MTRRPKGFPRAEWWSYSREVRAVLLRELNTRVVRILGGAIWSGRRLPATEPQSDWNEPRTEAEPRCPAVSCHSA